MTSVQTDTKLPHECAFWDLRHKSLFANFDDPALRITPKGDLIMRNICSAFDPDYTRLQLAQKYSAGV